MLSSLDHLLGVVTTVAFCGAGSQADAWTGGCMAERLEEW